MIKLIKDLTDNEMDKICKSQKYCSDCPLYLGEGPYHEEMCLTRDYNIFEKSLKIANKQVLFATYCGDKNGQNIEKMDDKE